MKLFGLIGYPVSHSFSQKFFTEKFIKEGIDDCEYQLFPIAQSEELLSVLAKHKNLKGLNVTIPHKKDVIKHLHSLSSEATQIGAVNCIKIHKNGQLEGFNTDAFGFEQSLLPLLKPIHSQALVFGDGGAAKAVCFILKKLGIQYLLVSRKATTHTCTYQDINQEILNSHLLLINTTPLGMFPNLHTSANIPYEYITEKHLAYDLVYNPEKSQFLEQCEQRGASIKNGLEMLHLQALKAWDIWNQ